MKKAILGFLAVAMVFCSTACLAEEIRLGQQEKEQISKLLVLVNQSFSQPFNEATLTNEQLIEFAVTHSASKSFPFNADYSYYIPGEFVDKTVRGYFGRAVKHQSVGGIKYANGRYLVPPGDPGLASNIRINRVDKIASDRIAVFYSTLIPDEDNKVWSDEKAVFAVAKDGQPRLIIVSNQLLKKYK